MSQKEPQKELNGNSRMQRMTLSGVVDICSAERNWTRNAIVLLSWLACGAAIYFMLVETGLIRFSYQPNDMGIISPTTIARIPKFARVFHYVAGILFVVFMGITGWLSWLGFYLLLPDPSKRTFRDVFSIDAWAHLSLLLPFANIIYRFMPYAASVAVGAAVLGLCRTSLFLYAKMERTRSD